MTDIAEETVPDEVDQANAHNEDFRAFVLQQHERRREPGDYTGINCIECGEEIPEGRRHAQPGCRRCIDCQTLHEHWRAL